MYIISINIHIISIIYIYALYDVWSVIVKDCSGFWRMKTITSRVFVFLCFEGLKRQSFVLAGLKRRTPGKTAQLRSISDVMELYSAFAWEFWEFVGEFCSNYIFFYFIYLILYIYFILFFCWNIIHLVGILWPF